MSNIYDSEHNRIRATVTEFHTLLYGIGIANAKRFLELASTFHKSDSQTKILLSADVIDILNVYNGHVGLRNPVSGNESGTGPSNRDPTVQNNNIVDGTGPAPHISIRITDNSQKYTGDEMGSLERDTQLNDGAIQSSSDSTSDSEQSPSRRDQSGEGVLDIASTHIGDTPEVLGHRDEPRNTSGRPDWGEDYGVIVGGPNWGIQTGPGLLAHYRKHRGEHVGGPAPNIQNCFGAIIEDRVHTVDDVDKTPLYTYTSDGGLVPRNELYRDGPLFKSKAYCNSEKSQQACRSLQLGSWKADRTMLKANFGDDVVSRPSILNELKKLMKSGMSLQRAGAATLQAKNDRLNGLSFQRRHGINKKNVLMPKDIHKVLREYNEEKVRSCGRGGHEGVNERVQNDQYNHHQLDRDNTNMEPANAGNRSSTESALTAERMAQEDLPAAAEPPKAEDMQASTTESTQPSSTTKYVDKPPTRSGQVFLTGSAPPSSAKERVQASPTGSEQESPAPPRSSGGLRKEPNQKPAGAKSVREHADLAVQPRMTFGSRRGDEMGVLLASIVKEAILPANGEMEDEVVDYDIYDDISMD